MQFKYLPFYSCLSKEKNAEDELGKCTKQLERKHQSYTQDLEQIRVDLERAGDEVICY